MSEQDPARPPEEGGERYVREIMRREAEEAKAAAARAQAVPPASRSRRLLPVLLLAAAVLTGWNVYRATHRPPVVTAAEEAVTARFAIYLVGSALEAYRAERGALPPDLATIDAEGDGVEYTLTEGGYLLRSVAGDSVFLYRAGEPLEPFGQAYPPQGGGIRP